MGEEQVAGEPENRELSATGRENGGGVAPRQ